MKNYLIIMNFVKKKNTFYLAAFITHTVSTSCVFAQDVSELSSVKPFTISGSLNLNGQHYFSSAGNNTGRPDVTGSLSFSPIVTLYGVQFPFNFYLTTSESSFRQPFNEFGVSPRYKWITVHLGYRSVQYSQFSLAYQKWLGAGIDVKSAWLRFSAMYGRFQKATDEDTLRHYFAIYKRMGYAFKLGFGSDQNYVDFNIFKGWDDSTSISARSTSNLRPPPTENAVVALSTKFGLLENKLSFDAEIAGSVFSRDLGASDENINEVPSFVKSFMSVKSSTRANWAVRSSVNYSSRQFRISLKYERVEPDFNSMGVGYITSDREDISVAPSLYLFNALRINASVGLRRNNLLNDKFTTTSRIISSFGAAWQASNNFGLDARYSNYTSSSSDGRIRVTDTTRIENVSQMFSFSPRYTFGTETVRHSVTFLVIHQIYDDRNVLSGALNKNNSTTGTLNYGSSIGEYGLNASTSYASSRTSTYTNTTFSFSTGASKSFFEKKLNLNLTVSFSRVRSVESVDSQLLPAFSGSYRLSERDSFVFNSRVSHNTRTNNPYTEIVSSTGYSRIF